MTTTVTIETTFGPPETVPAVVRGGWALHRAINRTECYALTYLPSNQCIDWIVGSPAALARALRNVARVGPPPVDPRRLKTRGAHPQGYTAWVSAIRAALGDTHQPPVWIDVVGEVKRP